MKKFIAVVLVTILSAFAVVAQAASPIWKVTNGTHSIFVAGTIHILPPNYVLPTEFDDAYAQAKTLVFETDMQVLASPSFQQTMLSRLSLPQGSSLKNVLTAKTYKDLQHHCRARGIPLAAITRFKAGMASIMLTTTELQRLNIAGEGVEDKFVNRALSDGKQLLHLETPEQQLAFLENLGEGFEDELVAYTLVEIQSVSKWLNEMLAAWRVGDLEAMAAISDDGSFEKMATIEEALLVKRNKAWLPQLATFLTTPDIELVMVGGLHLSGEQGLIHQLQKQGYQVEQL